jgi:hypothetical protein
MPAVNSETSAAAAARMGGFTERDKDIALEIAIRGLVSDAWRPPPTASTTSQAPQPRGNGWRATGPFTPPHSVTLNEARVHDAAHRGAGKPGACDSAKPKSATTDRKAA